MVFYNLYYFNIIIRYFLSNPDNDFPQNRRHIFLHAAGSVIRPDTGSARHIHTRPFDEETREAVFPEQTEHASVRAVPATRAGRNTGPHLAHRQHGVMGGGVVEYASGSAVYGDVDGDEGGVSCCECS